MHGRGIDDVRGMLKAVTSHALGAVFFAKVSGRAKEQKARERRERDERER